MNNLAEHIKKMAVHLITAAFKENVISTWERSSEDPKIFIKKFSPILRRYEKTHIDIKEMRQLKKDILEGTEDQVELLSKFDRLDIRPVRQLSKRPL